MTLVEFIAPIQNASNRDKILAVLYFKQRYENCSGLTIEQIRQTLHQARVGKWKKINIADVLAKSGHYVDTPGIKNERRIWCLTTSGNGYIQKLLNLPSAQPEIEHDIGSLEKLFKSIGNSDVKDYFAEALKCLQVNALRASVVFIWVGTIREIQTQLLTYGQSKLNAALLKHDPNARSVKQVSDFEYIKDKNTLLAALELGLYDKAQKDTLQEALNLRNRCGHPSNYKPGVKKVSGFIEDIISIVFV
jgi:hypothetical protein